MTCWVSAGGRRRWELRAKPKQPAARFVGLTGEVTGLQQVSDQQLLAASAEGQLSIWDLRRSDTPLRLVPAPDGRYALQPALASPVLLPCAACLEGNREMSTIAAAGASPSSPTALSSAWRPLRRAAATCAAWT